MYLFTYESHTAHSYWVPMDQLHIPHYEDYWFMVYLFLSTNIFMYINILKSIFGNIPNMFRIMLISVKTANSLQCLFTRVFLASHTCQCWKGTVKETRCKVLNSFGFMAGNRVKKITAVLPLIQAGILATSPERA